MGPITALYNTSRNVGNLETQQVGRILTASKWMLELDSRMRNNN